MSGISFNGVASGLQWGEIIDQLIAAESARTLLPLQNRVALIDKQRTAWTQFDGLVRSLDDVARRLRTGDLFGQFAVSGGTNAATGQAIVTATPTTAATPGTYSIEVLSLARAQKLSGAVVSDATASLGIGGSFMVAGQELTLDAADSLAAVRDKINAMNAGATPTRVSASIVSGATGGSRLVLTSDIAGPEGVGLEDGIDGVLRQLGLMDSMTRLVHSSDGAVAASIGSPAPGATTLSFNGQEIAVDLGSDSLDTIAARLRAAGISANVIPEPYGYDTAYRLQVGANVTATGDGASAATLAMLGFEVTALGNDNQIVASGVLAGAGGAAATGATSLVGLTMDGVDNSIDVGDAIHLTGTRGDGSTVLVGLTVQAGDTIDTLIARLNDEVEGLGGGVRPAQATLGTDGKLRLVDGVGGDSQLSFTLSVINPDGVAASLGGPTLEVTGRAREVTSGSAAQVLVDGVLHEASGNELSTAIAGVTLQLQSAEPGTVTELVIARDEGQTVEAMQELVTAYNAISSFIADQRRTGQPLAANATLRGALSAINTALRTEVPTAGEFTRAAIVGLSLDRYGQLQLDEKMLRDSLAHSSVNVKTLFGAEGIGAALEAVGSGLTRAGDGTVASITALLDQRKGAIERRQSDVERRLEMRRDMLSAQFIAMESLMGRLQSQGSWLANQLSALQPPKQ